MPKSAAVTSVITNLAEDYGLSAGDQVTVGQVMQLYAQSGLTEAGFLQVLSVVRTMTSGRQAQTPQEHMTIFLEVLRQQLGLPDEHDLSPGALS